MNGVYLGSHDMPSPSTDLIQGTLDMLILKSVALQAMHGFGITQRIEQISGGVFRVNPGSLLLAFQRMERAGLIDSEWRTTENNRRAKFYRITDKGRKQLKEQTREWERRVAAIARLLEA
jgi:PadR family transcriptional regulator